MPKEQARLLLEEFGFCSINPAKAANRDASHEASDRWVILVDDILVHARCDIERRRLILQVDVGLTPPMREAATHELLLQFNDHCDVTGVRLALDGADGAVVAISDPALSGLTADTLRRALANLLQQRDAWSGIVSEGIVSQGATEAPRAANENTLPV